MPQFRLHKRLKTILNQKETCEKSHFRMFLFVLEWFLGVHVTETKAISLCFA
jgi:hypothetical protein